MQKFIHLQDVRTHSQRQLQHRVVNQMQEDNLKNLGIQLTSKQKVEYPKIDAFKLDLEDGWWCTMTDNKIINSRFIIVTVHGCPGDHRQWAGLQCQMQSYCRWINLVVPGFDGHDERRGTYDGSLRDLSELIVRMIKKLNIEKFVFCGHSMGSIFMSYFVTHYEKYLEGCISITGILDSWYVGLRVFYYNFVIDNNLNKMVADRNTILNDDRMREKITKISNERTRSITFGDAAFPQLTQSQVCGYIKLVNSYPTGLSGLYELNRRMAPKMLKLYFFGRNDPLEEVSLVEEMFFRRCYEQAIEQADNENSQSKFCWLFDQTGHNAHKRRPKEIAIIIKRYLAALSRSPKPKL